jgi:hypothetical protein
MSLSMCLVSWVGILEYILEMSRDANLVWGVIGVCFSCCMRCVVLVILKEYGRGEN